MSIRQCPNCGATMPARKVAAYSYDLECASCEHPLGISPLSRNLAAFAGLAAGAVAWWVTSLRYASQPGALGWVWPVFVSYLVASAVAALTLMLDATLELRAAGPAPRGEGITPHVHH